MRTVLFALALIAIAGTAEAQKRGYGSGGGYNSRSYGSPYGGGYGTGSSPYSHQNSGYYNNRGTYVAPYRQTNPNGTQYDNYGTRGNVNPWTGSYGTRTPRY